jgi:Putative zinc-finger
MLAHEWYIERCALLAAGQLPKSEVAELRAHMAACPGCQNAYRDYTQLVTRDIPLSGRFSWINSGGRGGEQDSRERFLQFARAQGARFSEEVRRGPSRLSLLGSPRLSVLVPAFGALVIVAAAVAVGFRLGASRTERTGTSSSLTLARKLDSLEAANERLRDELAQSRQQRQSEVQARLAAEEQASIKAQRIKELEQALAAAQLQAQALQQQLAGAQQKSTELEARADESARLLAEARQELQRVHASLGENEANLVAQQFRIQELSEKLRLLAATLEVDRQMLAANRDISDMMGARNLYITDVKDFDTRGNPKKVFGRVFYTEGKSLVFYAFDLGDRRLESGRYSLQAWGQKESEPRSARSLGIFYADDKTQKRWVLKVDDPALLARIDSVFVTVEPNGGTTAPTGKKLLYADLTNVPNHP